MLPPGTSSSSSSSMHKPKPTATKPTKKPAARKRKRGQQHQERDGGFHDLCIELKCDSTTVEEVQEACRRLGGQQLGYTTIAFNETVRGRGGLKRLEGKSKVKAMETLWLATRGPDNPSKVLRRVTVVVEDLGEAQFLCGAIRSLKWADLVAARPTSDKALTFLCENGDVDIISLDLQGRQGFNLSPKQADKALARGLVFEVRYVHALMEENRGKRQQLLSNISSLFAATRGRGVICSSGAAVGTAAEWLRGPHDVMNLAIVLGLKEEQALAALTSTCQAARGHAEARRLEWLPVEVHKIQKTGAGGGAKEQGEEEVGAEEEEEEEDDEGNCMNM